MKGGSNLRAELQRATALGCRIVGVRRTGELAVSHVSQSRPIKINGRRRDAPRHLTSYLNQIEAGRKRSVASRPGAIASSPTSHDAPGRERTYRRKR